MSARTDPGILKIGCGAGHVQARPICVPRNERSGSGPCRVVTKPFTVRHSKLFLNAATWMKGSIRVEALTPPALQDRLGGLVAHARGGECAVATVASVPTAEVTERPGRSPCGSWTGAVSTRANRPTAGARACGPERPRRTRRLDGAPPAADAPGAAVAAELEAALTVPAGPARRAPSSTSTTRHARGVDLPPRPRARTRATSSRCATSLGFAWQQLLVPSPAARTSSTSTRSRPRRWASSPGTRSPRCAPSARRSSTRSWPTRSGRARAPWRRCTWTPASGSGWSRRRRSRSPTVIAHRLGLTGGARHRRRARRRRLHRSAGRRAAARAGEGGGGARAGRARGPGPGAAARRTATPPTTSRCSRSSGTPCAINPDRALRGYAKAHGWRGPGLPHRPQGGRDRDPGRRGAGAPWAR